MKIINKHYVVLYVLVRAYPKIRVILKNL